MNIFCNDNGKILYVDPQKIYQNSAGVNTIRFIGRFPSSAQVLMAYQLPQGDWTMPKMLAFVKEIEGVQAPNGGNFSVWEGIIGASPKIDTETGKIMTDENGQVLYDLDYTITENYGTANLQFYVYALGGGQLATASTSIVIEKGVPMVLPDFDTDEAQKLLTQILSVVANTQELYGNVETELEVLNTSVSANTANINALQTENATQGENITQNSENIQELQEQVSENTANINGLRADIQNEAHFRGYVQTNAEIQALKGAANDYAYSAESGTKWIFQNGAWVDSGVKVPDQLTPPSNTPPLMDGEQSVGTENQYARGDHRHPTDTSRIGVNEKGQPNGIPTLNDDGIIPPAQLPPLDYLPITGGVVNGSVTANEFLINDADEVTKYQAHSIQEGLNTYQFRGKSGTLALLSDLEPIETTANLAMQALYQASIVYKAETKDTYNERITAEGLNVVDGSEAVLKNVVGNTVRCENLLNVPESFTFSKPYTIVSGVYLLAGNYTISYSDDYSTEGTESIVLAIRTTDKSYAYHIGTSNKTLYIEEGTYYFQLFSNGYNYSESVGVTATVNKLMLNYGPTAKPYQPYFTGLKSASFAGIESTNADGTEISTLNFPKTPTPMGTTIDFENKKIIEGSKEIVFNGTESWKMDTENKYFRLSTLNTPVDEVVGICNLYPYEVDYRNAILITGTAGLYVGVNITASFNKDIEAWKSYLAELYANGNPLIIRYKIATPTETPFTDEQSASGNKYQVWSNGTEKVIDNDGTEFGADNTLTQNYIAIKE